MGGYGSGRGGGYPTSEATSSFILDIARLRREGLRPGIIIGMRLTWTPSWGDELSAEMRIDARDPVNAGIVLRHATRDNDEHETAYFVHLTTTRPRLGGVRWWFICPARGARCAKLFLPNGGRRFLSRDAYRLGYACQRETRADRLQRKARKLNRALGGDGEYNSPIPTKPNGMHWRTYERKAAQLRAVETAADRAWFEAMPASLLRAISTL